jgi:glycerol-3-phosphate O-acyltransferase/dihydroxyacetone phosphate acyltransferase
MLYTILKTLFRITFRFFFRKIFRINPERFPLTGPLIICAHHPGAFLDPIVIAASSKRRIYFLAKAAVFKGKFAKWLLPKFNMIPIYRKQDDPSQMHKNDETFAKCYEHLLAGDAILIFPEGVSATERKLRELKTGAARIALGASAASGFKTEVKIICLGINYDDPHLFRQDVLVNYSEPISTRDYEAAYAENQIEAARLLTDEIRARLEAGLIHIDEEEAEKITRQV